MAFRDTSTLFRIQGQGFDKPLPMKILNIEDKSRSSLLSWRGQFSPQLIEALLSAYCPENSVVLDPFSGSGTVLYEAAHFGNAAYGVELNPSAWILSRIYQLVNYDVQRRSMLLQGVKESIISRFPEPELLYSNNDAIDVEQFRGDVQFVRDRLSEDERIVFDALVILLDIANNRITLKYIHDTFYRIRALLQQLPSCLKSVIAFLADARSMPIDSDSIDFILTSPPYINVFNYHQNYRRSAEMLNWDLLHVAKSEIGSNRANRGNRFLTVIQYCLDMACVVKEMRRVCRDDAQVILVVGYESNVLGVPFYNADILEAIACESGLFDVHLRQKREFKNKFGNIIREDLLHLKPSLSTSNSEYVSLVARVVANRALLKGIPTVAEKNKRFLKDAIEQVDNIEGTPVFSNSIYTARISN